MKRIVVLCLILLNVLCYTKVVSGSNVLTPNSKSSILIEVETGKVIFANNENEKAFPASMTKIMTMLLVLEEIEKGTIKWEDIVTTSSDANSMNGSRIFLAVDEKMSVNDLFKSVAIASANDAAYALAEHVAGTASEFVSNMNKRIKELNLINTNFVNPTGLHDKDHYSTAYDMAYMARELLLNHEETLTPITSKYDDYIREDTNSPFWLVNTNKLIKYEGIDGLKTGWTEDAGYCLTATIKRNDMRLIGVVMGYETPISRNEEMFELLNYGVQNYELVTLLKKGDLIDSVEDLKLSPSVSQIVLNNDVKILKRKREELKNWYIKKNINYLQNDDVGYIDVFYDDEFLIRSNLSFSLCTKKANFPNVLIELIKTMIK